MVTRIQEKEKTVTTTIVRSVPTRSTHEGLASLWYHRHLITIMVWRDLFGKYRGSLLGALWPIINPLGHLLLYTFVFSIVLKVRFGTDPNMSTYALFLMAGLLPWGALSESLSRSPACILEVPNLVKRVVFPLEILPLAIVVSSLFSELIGLSVLVLVGSVYFGTFHWTLVYLPFIIVSQTLFIAGCSWLLASLGVFIQDLRHFMSLALSVWMYTSPLIYPASSFPPEFQFLAWANPMAGIIGDYRRVMLQGLAPDWFNFSIYTTAGLALWLAGFYFFYKTKHSFADVM